MKNLKNGIDFKGICVDHQYEILTDGALDFLAALQRKFNSTRLELLLRRAIKQGEIDAGIMPDFLADTRKLKSTDWHVAPCPEDLTDRRVEITGPVERKMMINALNSGASVFMADFEDSLSPTWENAIAGQVNCRDAVMRTINLTTPEGKNYNLNQGQLATLVVRPRGWHLNEAHILIDGAPISASLFDFGLYIFHNAKNLLTRGSGPYFYLPKMENHLEARLWNDVFIYAQDYLGIPQGSIRATCLIETVLAAFEMEEILYELRDHAAGLNAGRWDYIFSAIKKFRSHADFIMPDRAQVTMTVPFMRHYTELLVHTCHKRGAHAIGGMAAFIPNRKDPLVTESAIARVREDKLREASDGFDGTWVAHPDLVPIAKEIFDAALGNKPHQKHILRSEVSVTSADLISPKIPNSQITEDGLRHNVSIALQYLDSWLRGTGAAAIYNLMEDAATAEISRAELWQWVRHAAQLSDGRTVTKELYKKIREAEHTRLGGDSAGRMKDASMLLDDLVESEEFADFLTIPAYEKLNTDLNH